MKMKQKALLCFALARATNQAGVSLPAARVPGQAQTKHAPCLRTPWPCLQVGAAYNLLRPEALEAMWYMWRLTHDWKYRAWGWQVFQAFEAHCKVGLGKHERAWLGEL